MHADLTGRYLGVITPMPGRSVLCDLLKLIKTNVEPAVARINHKAADVEAASAVSSQAAEHLGLEPTASRDAPGWRRLSWPVTTFVRPERTGPAPRLGRA